MKIGLYFIALAIIAPMGATAQSSKCGSPAMQQKYIASHPEYTENYIRIKQEAGNWQNQQANERTATTTMVVPVVVHVLYNNATENISDAQVLSQIDVLNADYNRKNTDANKTPAGFQSVAGSLDIQFKMANRTPSGQATTGIIRKQITTPSYDQVDDMKFTSKGGDDAWNTQKYLNIWVCKLTSGLLGFAYLPGAAANVDGVVIGSEYFGTTGTVSAPFNKGRTTTHEVGHFLDMIHIWGDDGGDCSIDDNMSDTPLQGNSNDGKPTFPKYDNCTKTGNGIMFMNYMDYSDDDVMNIFTKEQTAHMNSILQTDRKQLISSNGYVASIDYLLLSSAFKLYPNPAQDKLTIQFPQTIDILHIQIKNILGVALQTDVSINANQATMNTEQFADGVYIAEITTPQGIVTSKFVVAK